MRLLAIPASGLLATGSFFYYTRHVEAVHLSPSDSIFQSKYHQRFNPNNNPTVHDLHVRVVPISQIDPALLERQDALIERYSAGVWAGAGFAIQRMLAHLGKQESASHQLWTRSELLESKYNPGTVITDEFIVLDKAKHSILIRGGDKVSKTGPRPLDGLIELSVQLKPEDDCVQFRFKSLFFQGDVRTDKMPMPAPVIWLHEQYAKALLESGVRHVIQSENKGAFTEMDQS
ncbi:hypothetical protein N7457_001229 [Penicillium paradoxum]|uniref:uncharacterized protein n=1 Tax=Penicillium paradoxum TaxID=176176 RepID=UPI002547CB07|nr:uncharacterized protein N7457_001229 [Penicillium paradoxum]KAJ5794630.1 hypothetical protein N7457_001229 [Penicillium paradoxum]